MRTAWSWTAALLTTLAITTGYAAAEKKVVERKPADKEPATDREFVIKTIACETAEVKFAEHALKHATNAEVKSLAQRALDEHTSVRNSFQEKAREMKVAVVEGLEKQHRDQWGRQSKLKGVAYDREYLRGLIERHEKGLETCERWSTSAEDSRLRELAATAHKMLKAHLEQARKLANTI